MTKYLCLDSATRSGVAWRGVEGYVKFLTRDFSDYSSNYGLMGIRFNSYISALCDELNPEHIAYEMPFFSQKTAQAGELLHGMAWECIKVAYNRNISYSKHSPSTIKKFICGNGRAKKHEVTAAVRALGHAVKDDNQADAVALLLLMEANDGQ